MEGKFIEEYFEELVDVIREIRSSERKVYEKVTDLFATAMTITKMLKLQRSSILKFI